MALWYALAALLCSATVAAAESKAVFESPSGLRAQVEFWKKIFTTHSRNEVVIHDTWHLDRVYSVLDFTALAESMASDAELAAYVEERTKAEKERIRAILVKLHGADGDAELTREEQRIRDLFRGDSRPTRFLDAAAEDRIRGQRGLRERFAAGIEISRRYLPEMEVIFQRAGLPRELTRLPLVESCFNLKAYSKAGAAGIWQFMPSAGRTYMRIDARIDERRDPIKSTHAAAALLQRNYEVLGNWPLAITAYNHGRSGMARAVDEVGSTDLVDIIQRYKGPLFKFASRNFYAEFLAAVEVERDAERYFGTIRPQAPVRMERVVVPGSVTLPILAQAARTDTDTLAELNPSFTPDVVRGRLTVPQGWRLCVPPGAESGFGERYASLAVRLKASAKAKPAYVRHQVRHGQTLAAIAQKYGTSINAIQRRNKLRSGAPLRAGQSLIIPRG